MRLRYIRFCGLIVILMYTQLLSQPITVRVWPRGAPGEIRNAAYHEDTVYTESGAPRIRHVTDPEIYVYPAKGDRNAAVIICPGGSYGRLAIDHEGFEVATWLNQIGVTGIVLKYRLPSDTIMTEKNIGPLQDALEAIRIVRRRSNEWKIDPHRVGIMGFSAGGHLAATASTLYDYKIRGVTDTSSAKPDFSLLIYPVVSMLDGLTHAASRENLLGNHPDSSLVNRFSPDLQVSNSSPPAFLVHAADDRTVSSANSENYNAALRRCGVPAELHLYQSGGHGFGLARKGGTESHWPEACEAWLKARGIIQ